MLRHVIIAGKNYFTVKVSRRVVKSSLVTLGVIMGVTLLIVVLNIDINKRGSEIKAIQDQNALFRLSVEEFGSLRTNKDLADKAVLEINRALPSKDELATFPREVEQLAEKYGLGLGFAFGIETLNSDEGVGSILYDLTASGSFEDILSFLREFEAHPYYISMGSFNLSKSIKEDSAVKGDVFVLKTQGEIFTR
jgi:Tfp pilus assembly protein PilO